jgi:hypothetical protein
MGVVGSTSTSTDLPFTFSVNFAIFFFVGADDNRNSSSHKNTFFYQVIGVRMLYSAHIDEEFLSDVKIWHTEMSFFPFQDLGEPSRI